MLDAVTIRFVDEALALPPQTLIDAYERMLDLSSEGGREANDAAVPSASENSELDRRVTLAVRLRHDELDAARRYLTTDAGDLISMAGRAILKRSKLSKAHYDVLMQPFVDVGVEVPPYRD